MDRTSNLIKQHEDLAGLVTEINLYLEPEKIRENASKVRSILSSLGGKLRVHLVLEDKVLYPFLIKSDDKKIRELTDQYITEMGHIKVAFSDYSKKWSSPTTISAGAENFISDTQSVFSVLAKRIEKENNELYPMVDRLESLK